MIASNNLKVTEAVQLFLEERQRYYDLGDGPTAHYANVRSAMNVWVVPYIGQNWLFEVNGRLLIALRSKWLEESKLCRMTINRYLRFVKDFMAYCEGAGYATEEQVSSCHRVSSIRKGRYGAVDPKRPQPADIDAVERTLAHLGEPWSVMVRLMLLTGMRPGEVLGMRICDTKSTDYEGVPTILYTPELHKNRLKDKDLAIPFMDEAHDLLLSWMERHPPHGEGPGYVFSQDGFGYQPWPSGSIRWRVTKAREAAGVAHWTPYGLRRRYATDARATGIKLTHLAPTMGHSNTRTTEIYARPSEAEAIAATRMVIEARRQRASLVDDGHPLLFG